MHEQRRWGDTGDKAFGISRWLVVDYLAAAVAVLHVVSWRQDGNNRMEKKRGGNFLSIDIWLKPDREPISGWLLCRLLASIRAAFGLTTAEQIDGGQASSSTCSYPKCHADEERRSDCICHSCLSEVSAQKTMGCQKCAPLKWLTPETDVSLCLF